MAAGVLERRSPVGRVTHSPTIFALSSGRPPSGIAVVRISGVAAFAALAALTAQPLPPPRSMALRDLNDPDTGLLLDRALVVRFPAPASATGDDLVELHLHGGPAVVAAVLAVLATLPGLALAAPGAFTRRAFDNGKLDLSQAEGLADLIDAGTEAQRRAALDQSGGKFRVVAEKWRATLIALLADTEARLDFADEADIAGLPAAARNELTSLAAEFAAALDDGERGQRVRDGLTVAVVGPVNTGKSSLVNALARREVAIVSDRPGTTRDVIEVYLDLGGIAATVIDTAGLRDSIDPVEREGIRRGRARAADADLVLDLGEGQSGWRVVTKVDLSGTPPGTRDGVSYLSTTTLDGMADFEARLAEWARTMIRPGEPVLVTRRRHRDALAAGHAALLAAADEREPVLIAESLRQAAAAMATITGRVGADDVLDAIFARFCIGK